MKLSVAIVGATGYTGLELIRLLLRHPEVKITAITSERLAGQDLSKVCPSFTDKLPLKFEALQTSSIVKKAKLAFLCLPHQESAITAEDLLHAGLKVIDLSADFRLSQIQEYEDWYGKHPAPTLIREAVYGLPELYREQIKKAKLVANPGCYPTSCILGLAPLVKSRLIDLKNIYCDAKSGTSGAGKTANTDLLFCEVNEGLKAYKVGQHRHTPEIEQELSKLAGEKIKISFTPHLIPMDRGILATLYATPTKKISAPSLHQLYTDFYATESFVKICPLGDFPNTKDVRMTNFCHIGLHYDKRTNRIVVISVIDNLTKGASGQAIQNMNLMMGFDETEGLDLISPTP